MIIKRYKRFLMDLDCNFDHWFLRNHRIMEGDNLMIEIHRKMHQEKKGSFQGITQALNTTHSNNRER
jgi:hypothetical protein